MNYFAILELRIIFFFFNSAIHYESNILLMLVKKMTSWFNEQYLFQVDHIFSEVQLANVALANKLMSLMYGKNDVT